MLDNIGLDATKPDFGVSDKVRLKPARSATETSYKIESSLVTRLDIILSNKRITKGADQTARTRRLVCAFVVRKQEDRFLASRPIWFWSSKCVPTILCFAFKPL